MQLSKIVWRFKSLSIINPFMQGHLNQVAHLPFPMSIKHKTRKNPFDGNYAVTLRIVATKPIKGVNW